VVLFYVNARFRVILMPVLIAASALLVAHGLRSLRERRPLALAAAAALAAACWALTQTSVCDAERARVSAFSWARYGEHLLAHARWPEARQALLKAAGYSDRDRYAHHGLGELAMHDKDYPRAAYHYLQSLKLGVDDPQIHHKLVTALIAAGDRQGAVEFLRDALRAEPEQQAPRKLLRGLGYTDQQIQQMQAGSESAPPAP
jgi:tetratricopeptide (TPR) repeat protein